MTDFPVRLNHSLTGRLGLLRESLQLNQVEVSALKTPLSLGFYENWLANNYHGEMEYLRAHLEFKKDPRLLGINLKSVISVSQSYFPAVRPDAKTSPARVALYARNEDYHFWLKQKLQAMIEALREDHPGEIFLPYVDSGPLLERDLGYQNGLGWFGKNSCLIHPRNGSLFFIAEILTSLPAEASAGFEPIPDFCGHCTRCLDVCPTGALTAPKTLKADLCISYLTIEARQAPPVELRKKMGDWFFGCDLCQTVCPWNEKVFRVKKIEKSNLTSTAGLLDLGPEETLKLTEYFRFLLTASHKQIQKFHFGSPLSRAGAKGLKRNALIVIANRGMSGLRAEVAAQNLPELAELAEWTLTQLSN